MSTASETSTPPTSVYHNDVAQYSDSDDSAQEWSLFDDLLERTNEGRGMELQVRGATEMPLCHALGRLEGEEPNRVRRNGEYVGGKKRRKKGEEGGQRKAKRWKKPLRCYASSSLPPPSSSSTPSIRPFHRSMSPSPSPLADQSPIPCQGDATNATRALPFHEPRSPSPPDPSSTHLLIAPPPASRNRIESRILYSSSLGPSSRPSSLPPEEPLLLPLHEAVERPKSALGMVSVTLAAPALAPPPTFTTRARILAEQRAAAALDLERDKEKLGERFEGIMAMFNGLLGASTRSFDEINTPLQKYLSGELKERAEASQGAVEALKEYFRGGQGERREM